MLMAEKGPSATSSCRWPRGSPGTSWPGSARRRCIGSCSRRGLPSRARCSRRSSRFPARNPGSARSRRPSLPRPAPGQVTRMRRTRTPAPFPMASASDRSNDTADGTNPGVSTFARFEATTRCAALRRFSAWDRWRIAGLFLIQSIPFTPCGGGPAYSLEPSFARDVPLPPWSRGDLSSLVFQ